jgi:hypothetical protein
LAALTRLIAAALAVASLLSGPPAVAAPSQNTSGRGSENGIPVRIDGPVRTDSSRDAFSILVGVVTVVGVPLLLYQIRSARQEGRSQRTRAIQERYFSREWQTTAGLTLAFLTVDNSGDCVDKIQAWHARSHAEQACLPRTPKRDPKAPRPSVRDVQLIMEFFEDLGTAYNRREIVRGVVHDSFCTPPIQIFTTGWWYICWRRKGRLLGEGAEDRWTSLKRVARSIKPQSGERLGSWLKRAVYPNTWLRGGRWERNRGEGLWAQFEQTTRSLREHNHQLKDTFVWESPFWILCLPSDEQSATTDDWDTSRRLSGAMNSAAKNMTDLALRIDETSLTMTEQLSDGTSRWRVLLVPQSVDTAPDELWKAQRNDAERIACWLACATRDHTIDEVIAELVELGKGDGRPAAEIGSRDL